MTIRTIFFLIKTAFTRAGYDFPFVVVRNGEEAINYFKGIGRYFDRVACPVPKLFLLDLKMPRLDGFEVLRWLRSHHVWRALPVIVLTNSCSGGDINHAYDLGANSFLTKPEDSDSYIRAVKQIAHFWLIQNTFPKIGSFGFLSENPSDIPAIAAAAVSDRRQEEAGVPGLPRSATGSEENVPLSP
jgi:CheY-like chemotaxis protein